MRIWTWRPGWDPFSEIQQHVDRLLDMTEGAARDVWQNWRQFPVFNLYEAAEEYLLVAPLAGVSPESLEITVTGTTVTLKGERRRRADVPDEVYRRQERWQGKWSRAIQVPDRADLTDISATLDNGLLVLKLPKAAELRPRQVPVKVSDRIEAGAVSTALAEGATDGRRTD